MANDQFMSRLEFRYSFDGKNWIKNDYLGNEIKVRRQFVKEISKEWRIDCNRWETIYEFLGYIRIYKYSILGKKNRWRLLKISGSKYLPKMPEVKFRITNEQFQKEYNGNRWLLPINMEVK